MELRVIDERAVLAGYDGTREREVDLATLALDRELLDALQEWAHVVTAVLKIHELGDRTTAATVVSRRGLQLTARVAAEMRRPILYRDPLTGETSRVDPPYVPPAGPRARSTEPTPWATGLAVSVLSGVVVLIAVLALAWTLAETNVWLAAGAEIVVTAGLLPSVWLARFTPIWRWVAFGVAGAIALSWIGVAVLVF